MSTFVGFILLFVCVFYIEIIISLECVSDPCILRPDKNIPNNNIIICTNNYNICIIDCSLTSSQCAHEVSVYSGSLNTYILCNNIASCTKMTINIGIPNTYPNDYDINSFNGIKQYAFINCNDIDACKETNIIINSEFTQNVTLDALNSKSIVQSTLNCSNNQNTCILNCGDHDQQSCLQTNYICGKGTCQCFGDSCPQISSFSPTINTISPTNKPQTLNPTLNPSKQTIIPTNIPTNDPINAPTFNPSVSPVHNPTNNPSKQPSISPTNNPSGFTLFPTNNPSNIPSNNPVHQPSSNPIINPTSNPSTTPTISPSDITLNPTHNPLLSPTNNPSINPTTNPIISTKTPSNIPTTFPSNIPSTTPVKEPSLSHSISPTKTPSQIPVTSVPSIKIETLHPTNFPTLTSITFKPEKNDIVSCTNAYKTCIIDCTEMEQCTSMRVNSISMETLILCGGIQSCLNSVFLLGSMNMTQNTILIYCDGLNSCENTVISVNGQISDQVHIYSNNINSFKNAIYTCNINSNGLCILDCNNIYDSSCINTAFICLNGICQCNGFTCPPFGTLSPTFSTSIPSKQPTTSIPTTKIPTIESIPNIETNTNSSFVGFLKTHMYIVYITSFVLISILVIGCMYTCYQDNIKCRCCQIFHHMHQKTKSNITTGNVHSGIFTDIDIGDEKIALEILNGFVLKK